jgi:hypothetical protein
MFIKNLIKKRVFGLPSILIAFCTLLLVGGLFMLARPNNVSANSNDYAGARTQFPNIVGTRLDTCMFCHASSGPPNLNPFGMAYINNGRSQAALVAIQNLDSDGDGFTNIQEIIALTFPGDPNDHPVAATATPTTVPTATKTAVPTATKTAAPSATNTGVPPSPTSTQVPSATKTNGPSPTVTQTNVVTATQTNVPTATKTVGPGPTATKTHAPTVTKTVGPRETETEDPEESETPEIRPTRSVTPTVICRRQRGDGASQLDHRSTPDPCRRNDDSRTNNGVTNVSYVIQGNQGNLTVSAHVESGWWSRIINWLKTIFNK